MLIIGVRGRVLDCNNKETKIYHSHDLGGFYLSDFSFKKMENVMFNKYFVYIGNRMGRCILGDQNLERLCMNIKKLVKGFLQNIVSRLYLRQMNYGFQRKDLNAMNGGMKLAP